MPTRGVGSPMNLTLVMTSTTSTTGAPQTSQTYALVMDCENNAHPPADGTWEPVPNFTPDPNATYEINPHANGWPLGGKGVAVYRKVS